MRFLPILFATQKPRKGKTMIFAVIVGIAILYFVLRLGADASTSKVRGDAMGNPAVRELLIEPIERWGKYDGSIAAQQKAQKAMALIERRYFPASPRAYEIFDRVLQLNIDIPLAAAYAFAVAEVVEDPELSRPSAELVIDQDAVAGMHIFFPALYNLATSELPPRKADRALNAVSQLLDSFLDADAIRRQCQ